MEHSLSPEDYMKYMFGFQGLGIPENAGYYYANRIIATYLQDKKNMTFKQLIEISPELIFKNAQYQPGVKN